MHEIRFITSSPGIEAIKLEYSLRLKIKRNNWPLADMCPQEANHCTLFESENELKFYNLKVCITSLASYSLLAHTKTGKRCRIRSTCRPLTILNTCS